MRIGVTFPHAETGTDPAAIRDFAQAVEQLGFTHILAYDHVLGADPDREGGWTGPYTKDTPFREPLVTFAYMAAITKTVEFTTGIIILPQRQTALFAKQTADLDLLSAGRLRVGIGTGWNTVEYEALGQDFHARGKRQEEQVRLLRHLWSDEVVDFQGKFDRVSRASINPRPTRRIPIWFGGSSPAVLKRMARLGDGWIVTGTPDDRLRAALHQLGDYIQAAGRDSSTFGLEGTVNISDGDPARWRRQTETWRSMGASHLSIRTMPGIRAPREGITIDDHIDTLTRYREAVPAEAQQSPV